MPTFFFDIEPETGCFAEDETTRSKAAEIMVRHLHQNVRAMTSQHVQPVENKEVHPSRSNQAGDDTTPTKAAS